MGQNLHAERGYEVGVGADKPLIMKQTAVKAAQRHVRDAVKMAAFFNEVRHLARQRVGHVEQRACFLHGADGTGFAVFRIMNKRKAAMLQKIEKVFTFRIERQLGSLGKFQFVRKIEDFFPALVQRGQCCCMKGNGGNFRHGIPGVQEHWPMVAQGQRRGQGERE